MAVRQCAWVMCFGSSLFSYAYAGPPVPYNGWSVANGAVATNCASGFTCATLAASPGFLQRNIRNSATGREYFQTILTGTAASGTATSGVPFSDETFVLGGTGGTGVAGIASTQTMRLQNTSPISTTALNMTTIINSGWAAEAGLPNISIAQEVTETDARGMQFRATATIKGNNDQNGNQIGTDLRVDTVFTQPVGMEQVGDDGSSVSTTLRDAEASTVRRIGGNMLTAAGTATLPNGRSISWQPGATLNAVWAGQLFTRRDDVGETQGNRGMGWTGGGFQSYDVLGDNVGLAAYYNFGSPGPYNWATTPFGPAPVMPVVRTGGIGGED